VETQKVVVLENLVGVDGQHLFLQTTEQILRGGLAKQVTGLVVEGTMDLLKVAD
jgi:hypothetical protein